MAPTITRERVKKTTSRQPTEVARIVREAKTVLADGDYLRARRIVAEGVEHFPRSARLRKLANVLAPPVVRVGHSDVPPEVRRQIADANSRWFRDHSAEHRGQWVAVENGVLLAAGATVQQIQEQLPPGVKPLITMVF